MVMTDDLVVRRSTITRQPISHVTFPGESIRRWGVKRLLNDETTNRHAFAFLPMVYISHNSTRRWDSWCSSTCLGNFWDTQKTNYYVVSWQQILMQTEGTIGLCTHCFSHSTIMDTWWSSSCSGTSYYPNKEGATNHLQIVMQGKEAPPLLLWVSFPPCAQHLPP